MDVQLSPTWKKCDRKHSSRVATFPINLVCNCFGSQLLALKIDIFITVIFCHAQKHIASLNTHTNKHTHIHAGTHAGTQTQTHTKNTHTQTHTLTHTNPNEIPLHCFVFWARRGKRSANFWQIRPICFPYVRKAQYVFNKCREAYSIMLKEVANGHGDHCAMDKKAQWNQWCGIQAAVLDVAVHCLLSQKCINLNSYKRSVEGIARAEGYWTRTNSSMNPCFLFSLPLSLCLSVSLCI